MIRVEKIGFTTSAAGAAVEIKRMCGLVKSIAIEYGDLSAGNITIEGYVGSLKRTIYSKASSNSDVIVFPKEYAEDAAGTDLTYDGTRKIPIDPVVDAVKVTIASGGDTKTGAIYVALGEAQ